MFTSITMFWPRLGRLILARAARRGLRWALRWARSKFMPKFISKLDRNCSQPDSDGKRLLSFLRAFQRIGHGSICSRSLVMTILRCRCDLSRKSTVGIIVAKQEWARYKGIAYLSDNKQRVALLIFEIQRATDSDFPMVIAYRKVVGLCTRREEDKRIKISKTRFYGLMPSLCHWFLF